MSHFETLAARPRPVEGFATDAAREYCAVHLRSLGFDVVERPLFFSPIPGHLGAPLIGGAGMLSLVGAAWLGESGRGAAAAIASVLAVVVVAGLALYLGGARGTRGPLALQRAVNLEAVRGRNPRVWLVAHLDSKAQPVSTAIRTLGALLLTLALLLAAVGALLYTFAAVPGWLWETLTILAAAGGMPLVSSTVGVDSDGAADNASGVAAVLEAVALVDSRKSVGVLITDAEELALAGARAWVIDRAPGIAINCDTIDDDGRFVIMRYQGARLASLAVEGARVEDPRAKLIRPLPGVLTDSVAFRDAGWETVTLSRGTIRTLNRIHTERDSLGSMRGTGIPAAARVLARLVEELA